jgi:hypothetical protein
MTRATSAMKLSGYPARRSRWNPISMPEVIPPAVTIRPASTTRARLGLHPGAIFASRSSGVMPGGVASALSGSLRFVAGSPSRSPIAP